MVLASDYPLMDVFWSMLVFFLFVGWLIALFHVLADIFRSRDLGGFAKAIWFAAVVVVPFVGVLVYLLARGDNMARHAAADAQVQQAAFDSYVKQVAGTSGPGDQLTQLAALRDSGQISIDEYKAGEAKVLASR